MFMLICFSRSSDNDDLANYLAKKYTRCKWTNERIKLQV